MNNMMNKNNMKKEGILTEVNDLSFHIHLRLKLGQGAEWVGAIGYPQASSNLGAIKSWVFENHELYDGLERQAKFQLMLAEVKAKIKAYINGEGGDDSIKYA